jgi:predicted MFS family arabinose efflux permease
VIFISGFGKAIYDPAMQAYIGEYVPYHLRARAIGTTELAWAGSLIIIAPIAGYLLEAMGIQSLFFALTIFNTIAMLVIWKFLPPDLRELDKQLSFKTIVPRFEEINREIVGALLFTFFLVFANELFFINYGAWMEQSFGLVLTALGTVTIVIAVAEITGEFGVITLADRIGKAKATFIGTVGSAVGYVILPYLEVSLPLALFAIFVIFIFIEIAIVASISLFTEIAPRSRNTMMSTNISSHSLGRVLGGILGGVIYGHFGDFTIIAWLATITAGIAAVLLWFVVWQENH